MTRGARPAAFWYWPWLLRYPRCWSILVHVIQQACDETGDDAEAKDYPCVVAVDADLLACQCASLPASQVVYDSYRAPDSKKDS